jgi:hypothetical protein
MSHYKKKFLSGIPFYTRHEHTFPIFVTFQNFQMLFRNYSNLMLNMEHLYMNEPIRDPPSFSFIFLPKNV